MFSQRFPKGEQGKLNSAPWLKFIHAANKIEPKFFGQPTFTGTEDGDYIERYPHATVIFPGDDSLTVKIVATTEHGNEILSSIKP